MRILKGVTQGTTGLLPGRALIWTLLLCSPDKGLTKPGRVSGRSLSLHLPRGRQLGPGPPSSVFLGCGGGGAWKHVSWAVCQVPGQDKGMGPGSWGKAGLRLLDMNHTHEQGGVEEEGRRRGLESSGPGSPRLQKRPTLRGTLGPSLFSVSTPPCSRGAEASPPKPMFSWPLATSLHPHPLLQCLMPLTTISKLELLEILPFWQLSWVKTWVLEWRDPPWNLGFVALELYELEQVTQFFRLIFSLVKHLK